MGNVVAIQAEEASQELGEPEILLLLGEPQDRISIYGHG